MEINIIQNKIYEIRGQRVILDFDLAALYEVETRTLNQSVKRNLDKFPEDFMFQLSKNEWQLLRSQFVILEKGKGRFPKYLPFVFTEHGVTMAACILRSEKAVKMNLAIVRAFIAIRRVAFNYQELAQKLQELEKKYNRQFEDIYEALNLLIGEKKKEIVWQKRERIGFKPNRKS